MVKALTVTFDDEVLEKLKRKKEEAGMTWREFILQLLNKEGEDKDAEEGGKDE